jgi:proteic killer suppression protein
MFPGLALNPLKGNRLCFCAVKVSGNWPVVFRFSGRNAELVDHLD